MTDMTAGTRNFERFASRICEASEADLRAAIYADGPAPLRDTTLGLAADGPYRAFYAPFDWINTQADVVIVGLTPGRQQALDAVLVLRQALLQGQTLEQAAALAKYSASFKGGMRKLGAQLMDHFQIHQLLGLVTTADLFGSAQGRVHATSALRYPVLRHHGNYSGHAGMLDVPFMREMVETCLAPELAVLKNAWVIPFGTYAHRAVQHLANRGLVDEGRILGGILHPGGQQWNRYKVQLGMTTGAAIANVKGGLEVERRSRELHLTVQALLQQPPVAVRRPGAAA
jgi:uracil-DNA glycosylase